VSLIARADTAVRIGRSRHRNERRNRALAWGSLLPAMPLALFFLMFFAAPLLLLAFVSLHVSAWGSMRGFCSIRSA
jgi:hypothetical protein